jgi:hypothetical protein
LLLSQVLFVPCGHGVSGLIPGLVKGAVP